MEIIGIMSGTSLDGCDIAHVKFTNKNGITRSSILNSITYPYKSTLLNKLKKSTKLDALEISYLNIELGDFFGECVNNFIKKNQIIRKNIKAIACHGHTVFHQPQKKLTLQIGCGQTIAQITKIDTINDFRTKDVLAGGQGAPLVPIGDFSLFKHLADGFLNIGGFCNISFKKLDQIIAFDICPGNLPLNKIANKLKLDYDKNGEIAKSGAIIDSILFKLNDLNYYKENSPKSLGVEWLENNFYPLIDDYVTIDSKSISNIMSTMVEHISNQIANVINHQNLSKILITGGGGKNTYLISKIKEKTNAQIIIPEIELIDYKEAIIFAYMGYLFLHDRVNCLSSVTGASHDVIGGVMNKY